jgi:uncharacterized protein
LPTGDQGVDLPDPATRRGSSPLPFLNIPIVCDQAVIPGDLPCEPDWAAFKIDGPLGFSLSGVLTSLLAPLAVHRIPVFVMSTFGTDYVLVKTDQAPKVREILRGEGHDVRQVPSA